MTEHEAEILGSSDLDALVFWLLILLTGAVICLSALWSLSTLQLDHDALDALDDQDASQGDFVSIDDGLARGDHYVVLDRLMEDECSVCKELVGQEGVRTLQCSHQFHSECIDKWFQGGNATCPLCRTTST